MPRNPSFLTPSTSCSTARSGCCIATVAKATKRSGSPAHNSASFSFCILMSFCATSRSALYQKGLMLSASTSMPWASICRMRSALMTRVSGFTRNSINALASGNAQCAWMSTVLMRRPFTTTSRRLTACPWACRASRRLQPTKATPAVAAATPLMNSLRVGICPPSLELRASHMAPWCSISLIFQLADPGDTRPERMSAHWEEVKMRRFMFGAALIGAFLLVAPVARAEVGVSLAQAPAEQVGMSAKKLERIREALKSEIDQGKLPGTVLMVARKGKLVHADALGFQDKSEGKTMALDSVFRIYSMTKPLVSVAAMMLVEDGKIQLTDPVSKFLPAFKGQRVSVARADSEFARLTYTNAASDREMTVQDLLRHTSG